VVDAFAEAVCISHTIDPENDWPGVVIYANPAFARLIAPSHHDVLGLRWIQLWPDAAHAREPAVRADLRAGRPHREALVRAAPDGADIWVELTVRPIVTGDEGAGLFVTVVRDITIEREVEERLRREHRQLSEAQDIAGLGTWEWDISFDLVHWSDQLYRIFGLDPERFEATYAAYLERVHPDDRELAAGCVRRCLEIHQPFDADYRIVLPDGTVRWLHSRGRVELGSTGTPVTMAGVCQDITARKELEDALLHQSLHDSLTGLPNRYLLLDRVELALGRARRERRSVAVCFLDVDRFKQVNDNAGHDAGDEVLRNVAARLRDAVRPSDTVARVGGDEFVVVAEDATTAADAVMVGARLTDALRFTFTFAASGENHAVTVSVGVALSQPDDLPTTLLFKADQAMYRAKRLGRDRSELYSPGSNG
jgi:diguanylate cyclase (GGDEF)-like protein/PAS domain S-box-containing protein